MSASNELFLDKRKSWGKRLVSFALLVLLFVSCCGVAFAASGSTIVYITRTGSKYHKGTCSYLRQSKIEITLSDAVDRGYTACSRCKPPKLDTAAQAIIALPTPSPTPSPRPTPRPTATPRATIEPKETPAVTPSPAVTMQTTATVNTWKAICLATWIIGGVYIYRERRKYKEKQEEARLLAEELEQKKKDDAERLYKGKNPLELCGAPSWVKIGSDGLPVSSGDRKWGNAYTFYRSSSGTCYHDNFGCSGARIPIHVLRLGKLKPCGRCKPECPNMDWYYEYQRIRKIKSDYGIE